ncbi:MAG: ornithine cyclodeaminase [Gammaproteobacteria bacterium]|nr:ornithine cyclodeaminase [Gammaproteobacteria bacterium]
MMQLDAEQVAARLGRGPLIDALERAFQLEYQVPARQHYAVGVPRGADNTLLIMPAWRAGGRIGVKLATVFPGNAARGQTAVHATYALFDGTTGAPVALLDGTELTRRRTAAASALAARYLASPHASKLLVVGTGGLAPHLVESHAAVRPIGSVRVWGRRLDRAETVVRNLGKQPYGVEAVDDLEAAVRWADVISCATLAETPVVLGAWLRPGQHLDLIGSFTAAMREADDDALIRSSIYVDTRAGALADSGELLHALAAGAITTANIRGELSELARAIIPGRRSADEITLFKSVGSAIEDLAAAEFAYAADPPPPLA